jgi:hypothetical protein
MPWDEELFALFDDLESQAQAAFAQEREAELADRERAEYAAVPLAERLMASVGREVVLDVVGVGRVAGELARVARGWLLVRSSGQDWIVPHDALAGVAGASDRATPDIAWPVTARLGLGSALRRLADAGERCVLRRRDGGQHDGVIARVGRDFVELLTGEPRRTLLVPTAALAAVQSRD